MLSARVDTYAPWGYNIHRKQQQNKSRKDSETMNKYEVWVTRWSEEHKSQIKVIAGEFNEYMNASLFAQAYADHYHATVEIISYKRHGSSEITPTM